MIIRLYLAFMMSISLSAEIDKSNDNLKESENDGIAATFERAKLNGVTFRAIGNEPGWILDIISEEEVMLHTNLGQDKTMFKVVTTYKEKNVTEYKMKSENNTLFVRIENRVCKDTMVDRSYASTVYMNFDGHELRGCGKALY